LIHISVLLDKKGITLPQQIIWAEWLIIASGVTLKCQMMKTTLIPTSTPQVSSDGDIRPDLKEKPSLPRRKQEFEEKKKELVKKKEEVETLKTTVEDTKLKEKLKELEIEESKLKKKEEELKVKERLTPKNVDNLSKDGWSKTLFNKQEKRKVSDMSEEERESTYKEFVGANKKKIEHYGMLSRWDDCQKYLLENPELVCEDTANYLAIWCLNLAIEDKINLMEFISKQVIAMPVYSRIVQTT